MNKNTSVRKSLYWFAFFLAMLVLPAIACDEDISPNDVRDAVSEVYNATDISAQCAETNIYHAEGQCK